MEVTRENMNDLRTPGQARLKILIVEDDFASFKVLEEYLCEYGDCFCAVDGTEAVQAFRSALEQGQPYGLICLDIMLPELDGHRTLEEICRIEREHGVDHADSVKVIMTSAIDDSEDIVQAFKEGCKAYIIKPVTIEKLLEEIQKLDLIS